MNSLHCGNRIDLGHFFLFLKKSIMLPYCLAALWISFTVSVNAFLSSDCTLSKRHFVPPICITKAVHCAVGEHSLNAEQWSPAPSHTLASKEWWGGTGLEAKRVWSTMREVTGFPPAFFNLHQCSQIADLLRLQCAPLSIRHLLFLKPSQTTFQTISLISCEASNGSRSC